MVGGGNVIDRLNYYLLLMMMIPPLSHVKMAVLLLMVVQVGNGGKVDVVAQQQQHQRLYCILWAQGRNRNYGVGWDGSGGGRIGTGSSGGVDVEASTNLITYLEEFFHFITVQYLKVI